jgi:hypothetical protein
MPIGDVAREILAIDVHEAYALARKGELVGAFKIGKRWYVSLPRMIEGMQLPRVESRSYK